MTCFFFFLKGKWFGIKPNKSHTKQPAQQGRNWTLHHIRLKKRSYKGGVTPFQMCLEPDLLACWASLWATELKFLLECLKRQVSKDSLAWRIPWMRCPKLLPVAFSWIAWMAFEESNSIITRGSWSFWAKSTPCSKAMISVSSARKQAWRGLQRQPQLDPYNL